MQNSFKIHNQDLCQKAWNAIIKEAKEIKFDTNESKKEHNINTEEKTVWIS